MHIIEGGMSVDDRGIVRYANDFDFKDVKRFYMVENHCKGFIRAWHGHKKEAKYVLVVRGSALLYIGKISNWSNPEKRTDLFKYVLSASKPQVLHIPPEHVNGFMTLTDHTQVMFFSTTTMEDAINDDYRYPVDYWDKDIWKVEER